MELRVIPFSMWSNRTLRLKKKWSNHLHRMDPFKSGQRRGRSLTSETCETIWRDKRLLNGHRTDSVKSREQRLIRGINPLSCDEQIFVFTCPLVIPLPPRKAGQGVHNHSDHVANLKQVTRLASRSEETPHPMLKWLLAHPSVCVFF